MQLKRAIPVAIAAMQIAAIAVLALLVWQNYQLRRLVRARVASAGQFFVGDRVPTIPVHDLAGRQKLIDLRPGRSTVVIVEPTCGSCEKTMQDARNVPSVTLISLAPTEPTQAAAEKAGITGNIYTTAGVKLPARIARKAIKYPQIILVDRGTVVRVCATVNECR